MAGLQGHHQRNATFPRLWLLLALIAEARAEAQGLPDTLSLLQVQDSSAGGKSPRVSDAVLMSPSGPMAITSDGPILGVQEEGYIIFRGVPYAETPTRFLKSEMKKPWEPNRLDATEFRPACIGAGAGVSGPQGESEDCLSLNIWVSPGGRRKMPVLIYFHGGMNQHGAGHEPLRQGDMIVQSSNYPVIFINFDFRLGIFGWVYGEPGTSIVNNLGLRDQQLLLQWVQRHISAFGGDPNSVTLMGQSEGGGILIPHLVSPGSAGLFHRCIMFSPPADIWSRTANSDRTKFISERAGCKAKGRMLLRCLRKIPAQKLWNYDWNSDLLARPKEKGYLVNVMALGRFILQRSLERSFADLGWHAVVDGETVPGEPRKLIAEGRWNKVPVLVTTTKNESTGVMPDITPDETLQTLAGLLLKKGEFPTVSASYVESLAKLGISAPSPRALFQQIISDKMWTCDIYALARDMARTGGHPHIGMFWHSPKYDPVGDSTSKACLQGAACHSADMPYLLPQGRGMGIDPRLPSEVDFSRRYSHDFLSFAYGQGGTWAPFDTATEPVTFYDMRGPRVVPGYRKDQCRVLDASMNAIFPEHMQRYR